MDKEHKQTDKRLTRMERHLLGIYKRANNELGDKWKKYISSSNQRIKSLEKDLKQAQQNKDKQEVKRLTYELQRVKQNFTLLDNHYRALTEQLTLNIAHVNEVAVAYINEQLPPIYALNYNALDGLIKGYSFEAVDPNVIKLLATTDTSLLPYKDLDVTKDMLWNQQKINAEVMQGILQGESMDKIANRLSNVIGMNATTAIRNARTSVTSAENKGRIDSYHKAEEDGVILEKQWLATYDHRTRDAHMELDHKHVPIDEPFENSLGKIMYPADPNAEPANVYNCRCTLVSYFKGFKSNLTPEQRKKIKVT